MRFTKTRPSAKNKDVKVFEFAISIAELLMLYSIAKKTFMGLPKYFEIQPPRARLKNMCDAMEKVLHNEDIDVKVIKKDIRDKLNEVNEMIVRGHYKKNETKIQTDKKR